MLFAAVLCNRGQSAFAVNIHHAICASTIGESLCLLRLHRLARNQARLHLCMWQAYLLLRVWCAPCCNVVEGAQLCHTAETLAGVEGHRGGVVGDYVQKHGAAPVM